MPKIAGPLVLLCVCVPRLAGEADHKKRSKAIAQEMTDAFLKSDYEKFAKYVNPALIKLAGGREKLLATMKIALEKMEAGGVKVVSFQVLDATDFATQGRERFVILPSTTIVSAPGTKVTIKSFMVGASDDGGRTWTFLEGGKLNAENLKILLPNFPEDLKLPATTAPIIDKTP
jgi:hypothetical protein